MWVFYPTRSNILQRITALFVMPRIQHPDSATAKHIKWTRPTAVKPLKKPDRDVEEGADMVMVKPVLAYLDIVVQSTPGIKRAHRRL